MEPWGSELLTEYYRSSFDEELLDDGEDITKYAEEVFGENQIEEKHKVAKNLPFKEVNKIILEESKSPPSNISKNDPKPKYNESSKIQAGGEKKTNKKRRKKKKKKQKVEIDLELDKKQSDIPESPIKTIDEREDEDEFEMISLLQKYKNDSYVCYD